VPFLPGDRFMRAFYRYHRWRRFPLAAVWFAFWKRFWGIVGGVDIPLSTRIGAGLWLPHPVGVVIHEDSVIGANCVVRQNVTLGIGGRIPGAPTLADGVIVGAGAKIIGGVTIGEGAEIGANAVVIRDVPPGGVAVGVPARVLRVTPPRSATTELASAQVA
jgi:serine O-acetyltransferase